MNQSILLFSDYCSWIYLTLGCVVSVLLIKSVNPDPVNHKIRHWRLKLFMLLLAFDFFPPFIPYLVNDWLIKLSVEMSIALIDIYMLICIHSLYTKFQKESSGETVELNRTLETTETGLPNAYDKFDEIYQLETRQEINYILIMSIENFQFFGQI